MEARLLDFGEIWICSAAVPSDSGKDLPARGSQFVSATLICHQSVPHAGFCNGGSFSGAMHKI